MSVLINGMGMPKSCEDCSISNCKHDIGYTCSGKRPVECPLIEIPSNHGRLIDSNILLQSMYNVCDDNSVYNVIFNIPSIFEPKNDIEEKCRCGGTLSEIREHNGKKYRHCYSCHFEFEI